MLNNVKKITDSKQTKAKKTTDNASSSSKTVQDDNLAKNRSHMTSTPRSYVQKTTSDIYSTKRSSTTTKIVNNLKSTPSIGNSKIKTSISKEKSISKQESNITNAPKVKKTTLARASTKLSVKDSKTRTAKDLPFVNVTVNSPPSKRTVVAKEEISDNHKTKDVIKDAKERQRQKTRTLDDFEVKVLTPVDNNEEMKNLTRKLIAKPKSFFVDLEQPKKIVKEQAKSSDEDVSYEDDFESYESDFESCHSEDRSNDVSGATSDATESNNEPGIDKNSEADTTKTGNGDDEKMLDSGHFEWSDTRKTDKFIPMDNIDEGVENRNFSGDAKKVSLTDEGFQEMSSSSGLSSMKTMHTDVLDRELFIDFQKSKDYKKKRQSLERFRRRVNDLLSVIKLHEMPYFLFEVKPIPYDVYMATFGRSNYIQNYTQTFDDGVDEEIETDEINFENKWTQHPVEFSKHEVYVDDTKERRESSEDCVSRINFFLIDEEAEAIRNSRTQVIKYKNNPLRIFFDQKDGAGKDAAMSDQIFESKIKKIDFDPSKLRKFLKKIEGRISNLLSTNSGTQSTDDFSKKSKWSFSTGYKSLLGKRLNEGYLKCRRVSKLVFSDQKSNLLMTVHNKNVKVTVGGKSLACLWDVGVVNASPIKVLVAIDNIALCVFRGNAEGIFVGALDDGSIHLWDLSEQATWKDSGRAEAADQVNGLEMMTKTQTELDREWSLKSSGVNDTNEYGLAYRASAYTSSACALRDGEASDKIVGLEFVPSTHQKRARRAGDKTVAQVCSLQRNGVLTIWTILEEKSKTSDIGKAFWSKCKLQKTQNINFLDYIEVPVFETAKSDSQFKLAAAKRRLLNKREQRKSSKSSISTVMNVNSSSDVASTPRKLEPVLPSKTKMSESWESGLLCSTLKIVLCNDTEYYLVGRNCGEILFCTRNIGIVKVKRIVITNASTTITTIESSAQNLPCFLVGTDTGNIHLCSIEAPQGAVRVLLTLDCRSCSTIEKERIRSDHKGRYVGTTTAATASAAFDGAVHSQVAIKSIGWLSDPCRLVALSADGALSLWDFTRSDMHATYRYESETNCICFSRSGAKDFMAVLTADGELEVHRLDGGGNAEALTLFNRYIKLL